MVEQNLQAYGGNEGNFGFIATSNANSFAPVSVWVDGAMCYSTFEVS
jgi:hypothetical protein